MKLTAADVDRIIADNVPKPTNVGSVDDFLSQNNAQRLATIKSFAAQRSQSAARHGEELPAPPKQLTSLVEYVDPDDSQEYYEPSVKSTALPRALTGLDLNKITSRAELIQGLTLNLPINEVGLPRILYRPDLLDWQLFSGETPEGHDTEARYAEMQAYLNAAALHLSYAEGFPALPTGEPLWGKLPFEHAGEYAAFTEYCELTGARQTAKLSNYPHEQVLNWLHEHYWQIRARAFDMMHTVHAAKMREQRMLSAEDDHYIQAENLLGKLRNLANEVEFDQLKTDPKAYVEVLEKVVKLQRLSLGLSSMGNVNDRRQPTTESVELVMRKVSANEVSTLKLRDDSVNVRQLLQNPDALATAQELIVRISKATENNPTHSSEE